MFGFLKDVKVILSCGAALFLGLGLGYSAGKFLGHRDGVNDERLAAAQASAKNAIKSIGDKQRIENEVEKLDTDAVDAGLIANGWMRSETDR